MSMRLLMPVAQRPGTSGSSVRDPPPLARDILAARMKKVEKKLRQRGGEGGGCNCACKSYLKCRARLIRMYQLSKATTAQVLS